MRKESDYRLMNVPKVFHRKVKLASAEKGVTMAEYLRNIDLSQNSSSIIPEVKKPGRKKFDIRF